MYWIGLGRLKNDLIEGRIAEREAFSYFLAVLIVDTIFTNGNLGFPGTFEPTIASFGHLVVPVVIAVVATLLLYRVNGGANGKSFFVRYFPLLWVVGIRFLPLAAAVLGTWFYFQFQAGEYTPTWRDVALWNSIYAIYYWRVWVHFREVMSRAVAT
jgi:hypothetical protein